MKQFIEIPVIEGDPGSYDADKYPGDGIFLVRPNYDGDYWALSVVKDGTVLFSSYLTTADYFSQSIRDEIQPEQEAKPDEPILANARLVTDDGPRFTFDEVLQLMHGFKPKYHTSTIDE